METENINPIYQHLTRGIDPARQETGLWAAVGLPAIVIPCLTALAFFAPSGLGTLYQYLFGGCFVLALLAFAPVAAAASAIISHREIRGGNFALIGATTLEDRQIAHGFISGISARLKDVRWAADAMVMSVFAIPVVLALISLPSPPIPGDNGLNLAPLACIIPLCCWWIIHQTMNASIRLGVFAGFWLRPATISVPIVASAITMFASEMLVPVAIYVFIELAPWDRPFIAQAIVMAGVLMAIPVATGELAKRGACWQVRLFREGRGQVET